MQPSLRHRCRRCGGAIASAAGIALIAAPVAAQNVPTGFVIETVATWSGTGDAPYDWTELNPPTDTRKIVAHRDGGLRLVMPNGTVTTIGTIPSFQTGSERGLLSINCGRTSINRRT